MTTRTAIVRIRSRINAFRYIIHGALALSIRTNYGTTAIHTYCTLWTDIAARSTAIAVCIQINALENAIILAFCKSTGAIQQTFAIHTDVAFLAGIAARTTKGRIAQDIHAFIATAGVAAATVDQRHTADTHVTVAGGILPATVAARTTIDLIVVHAAATAKLVLIAIVRLNQIKAFFLAGFRIFRLAATSRQQKTKNAQPIFFHL